MAMAFIPHRGFAPLHHNGLFRYALNSGELGKSLVITLKRRLMGLALGVVAGTLLGVLGGLKNSLDSMIMPAITWSWLPSTSYS